MMNANRRTFLLGTGVLGAGLASSGLVGASGTASQAGRIDPENPRFTVAVMPDTQYLFDADRGDSTPLDASLRYVLKTDENIVFLAHLGDLTEHGQPGELAQIGRSFEDLDRHRFPYSVLAGNHDIDSSTDDQRGPTPFLSTFGPKRAALSPAYRGSSKDGYNSYHIFRGGGRQWLLLALDWRPSASGIAWANSVINQHPDLPVILTIHEMVYAEADGQAQLSEFGQRVWRDLVADNDQIFLTLNGHFWPPGRTVLRNKAGNDVHLHITNYQDRYYGGSAMIRLYRFDLARGVIDVHTVSPWLLAKAPDLNELERQEIERTGDVDYFSVPIDFEQRFAGFAPVPVPPPRPARDMLLPGTIAYWRFDNAAAGTKVESVRDLSGQGNDLKLMTLGGGSLTYSTDFDRRQPSHASLQFTGSKNPPRGSYLQTVDSAPLNRMDFASGYTIEAFVKLPPDFKDGNHAWCGVFSRLGTGADAGKTGDDPSEPAVTLSLSDGAGFQWATFPLNTNSISTNWSHELQLDKWWHVAVVNDGTHTTMYVDGCPVVRNPRTSAAGLANPGTSWLLGGYAYDRTVEQGFHGWIGDVRVVARPLPVSDFMLG
ncbi:Calcineurin-like phosphoesterase [Saccharopolyspora shandongensis]|uniref:Calcineurin-like phosphoesterase n=1 Tax=Saccharopolyspora shandongensis TaxID=418495 RepID=A0A1H3B3Q7_9PSEU|nr:LamG-like jellyroll fold domain-containing protein [Saccharopolyspora shandongensis]SDX36425.1 Calcineurin-like phosphoesterase [Saccharopolyspora shandongensis]